jgi:hypothetical protein
MLFALLAVESLTEERFDVGFAQYENQPAILTAQELRKAGKPLFTGVLRDLRN